MAWVVFTLPAASWVSSADNSLQFSGASVSGVLVDDVSQIQTPDLTDAQCAITEVYFRNSGYQYIYIGDAGDGIGADPKPVQISIGGDVTTVTAPGNVLCFCPRGMYLVKLTRQAGPLLSSNVITDNPVTGASGTAASVASANSTVVTT